MFWSKRKKEVATDASKAREITIEVIAHKNATRREVQKTKKVADDLNEILESNGITLKIFAAAGGRHGH